MPKPKSTTPPNAHLYPEGGPGRQLKARLKAGEVMVYRHEGNWECMDHGRDVVHLNKLWKNSQAFWRVWD